METILGVTIAICTWNRSQSLRATLLSLQHLVVPQGIDLEILIVNNNCMDDTDEVVEQLADELPIRLLHEARQGLSCARNSAVKAARGDYILWTDDDVIVDPNWLAAYVNAFKKWPDAALFGGPIKLALEGNPPAWFHEMVSHKSFASIYAHRDFGSAPIMLNSKEGIVPYGPNFCTRAREQKNHLYKLDLGRVGKEQVRGEEDDMVRTLLDAGAEGWWIPEAMVNHVVIEDQQTRAYLRGYFMGQGRSNVRLNPRSKLGSVLRFLRWLPPALMWEIRFQVARFRKEPEIWFRDLRMASICWGRVFEAMKIGISS